MCKVGQVEGVSNADPAGYARLNGAIAPPSLKALDTMVNILPRMVYRMWEVITTRDTGYRTQGTGRRAWGTGHGAQGGNHNPRSFLSEHSFSRTEIKKGYYPLCKELSLSLCLSCEIMVQATCPTATRCQLTPCNSHCTVCQHHLDRLPCAPTFLRTLFRMLLLSPEHTLQATDMFLLTTPCRRSTCSSLQAIDMLLLVSELPDMSRAWRKPVRVPLDSLARVFIGSALYCARLV